MSLLKLLQTQMNIATENSIIAAASQYLRPVLKSPITHVIISFAAGYFATIKIREICGLIRDLSDKKRTEPQNDTLQDSVGDSQDGLNAERPLIKLTKLELRNYSGVNANEPIYTSLNSQIYDISSCRESISRGELYSWVAGASVNDVIKIPCDCPGICTCVTIESWEQSLNAEFKVVGCLTDDENSGADLEIKVVVDTTV